MASKAEVIAFLKSNYKLEEMSPGLFSMLFEQENGRTQMLFAGVFDSFIRVDSPFGALGSVDIPSALDDSSILGLGAVGDYITVRHLILTADLDANEIFDGFGLVAEVADNLEAKYSQGDAF
jgi:hypothetical protein